MKAEDIHDEIRLIREMVEKTRRGASGSGFYLILWGALVILAVVLMYVLIYFKLDQLIWVDWLVLMGIGVITTMFASYKAERRAAYQTYAGENIKYLWMGCGIAFILTGFVFPLTGAYATDIISILICTIAGIAVFVTGGILDWNFLKWCGVVWWLAAIIMLFVHPYYRAMLFIPAVFFGYLLPGIVINRMYKRGGAQ